MANQQFPSLARTASFNGADNRKAGQNIRGVKVVLDITAVPGVDTVLLTIQAKDPVSGKYVTLLAGVAEAGVATRVYTVYPGLVAAANAVASDVVPDDYRVTMTHSAVTSFTYSIGVVELE